MYIFESSVLSNNNATLLWRAYNLRLYPWNMKYAKQILYIWLQISMQNVLRMNKYHSLSNLEQNVVLECNIIRQGFHLYEVIEDSSGHQLHDQC